MDALQEAYLAWQKLAPFTHTVEEEYRKLEFPRCKYGRHVRVAAHFDGECCSNKDHHMDVLDPVTRLTKKVPVPDDHPKCCARELAWRKYRRIRDGIQYAS